jgi:phenylalanine-4-hydroxylase
VRLELHIHKQAGVSWFDLNSRLVLEFDIDLVSMVYYVIEQIAYLIAISTSTFATLLLWWKN